MRKVTLFILFAVLALSLPCFGDYTSKEIFNLCYRDSEGQSLAGINVMSGQEVLNVIYDEEEAALRIYITNIDELGGGGSFDATEQDDLTWSDGANATITWTFDVSGAVDGTMVAGDGIMTFSHALASATLNTGQGANELYDMDQNVLIASTPTFAGLTIVNAITEFSIDGDLTDDSDSAVPTEKAVKYYVDNYAAAGTSGSNNQILTDDGAGGIVSEANLTFDGTDLAIALAGKIYFDGGGDTYGVSPSADVWTQYVGGVAGWTITEDTDITFSVDGVNFMRYNDATGDFDLLGSLNIGTLYGAEDTYQTMWDMPVTSSLNDGDIVGAIFKIDGNNVFGPLAKADGSGAADEFYTAGFGGNGSAFNHRTLMEEVTIPVGSGLDPVVTTTGNLCPANCIVTGIVFRVIDAPGGGATTLDIGITGGDLDAYIDGASCDLMDETGDFYTNGGVSAPILNRGGATTLTLTTNADVADDDMIVRVIVFYDDFTVPAN